MFFKANKSTEQQDAVTRLACSYTSVSDKGPQRSTNEDSLLIIQIPDSSALIAIVADGMGGHNAGDIASKMACEKIATYLQNALLQKKTDYAQCIENAFQKAHKDISEKSKQDPRLKEMGCTATCVLIIQNNLYMGHIGDSRLYAFRDASLIQLSEDHTMVNEMFKRGEITQTERDHHEQKNLLTQALGATEVLVPQILKVPIPVKHSDAYFICSDGLYDIVTESELQEVLTIPNKELALECLLALALKRNAPDNISGILLSFKDVLIRAGSTTKEIVAQL